jgi:hypothetical protein
MNKFHTNPRKALLIVFLFLSSLTGITSWSQSTDATLKELLVAGVRIDNFASEILSYDIVLVVFSRKVGSTEKKQAIKT